MDDAFVLLAAWRRTSPSLSVSKRLGQTYAEAAVSITITSLTNFISFMIGTITPFPSVRKQKIFLGPRQIFLDPKQIFLDPRQIFLGPTNFLGSKTNFLG